MASSTSPGQGKSWESVDDALERADALVTRLRRRYRPTGPHRRPCAGDATPLLESLAPSAVETAIAEEELQQEALRKELAGLHTPTAEAEELELLSEIGGGQAELIWEAEELKMQCEAENHLAIAMRAKAEALCQAVGKASTAETAIAKDTSLQEMLREELASLHSAVADAGRPVMLSEFDGGQVDLISIELRRHCEAKEFVATPSRAKAEALCEKGARPVLVAEGEASAAIGAGDARAVAGALLAVAADEQHGDPFDENNRASSPSSNALFKKKSSGRTSDTNEFVLGFSSIALSQIEPTPVSRSSDSREHESSYARDAGSRAASLSCPIWSPLPDLRRNSNEIQKVTGEDFIIETFLDHMTSSTCQKPQSTLLSNDLRQLPLATPCEPRELRARPDVSWDQARQEQERLVRPEESPDELFASVACAVRGASDITAFIGRSSADFAPPALGTPPPRRALSCRTRAAPCTSSAFNLSSEVVLTSPMVMAPSDPRLLQGLPPRRRPVSLPRVNASNLPLALGIGSALHSHAKRNDAALGPALAPANVAPLVEPTQSERESVALAPVHAGQVPAAPSQAEREGTALPRAHVAPALAGTPHAEPESVALATGQILHVPSQFALVEPSKAGKSALLAPEHVELEHVGQAHAGLSSADCEGATPTPARGLEAPVGTQASVTMASAHVPQVIRVPKHAAQEQTATEAAQTISGPTHSTPETAPQIFVQVTQPAQAQESTGSLSNLSGFPPANGQARTRTMDVAAYLPRRPPREDSWTSNPQLLMCLAAPELQLQSRGSLSEKAPSGVVALRWAGSDTEHLSCSRVEVQMWHVDGPSFDNCLRQLGGVGILGHVDGTAQKIGADVVAFTCSSERMELDFKESNTADMRSSLLLRGYGGGPCLEDADGAAGGQSASAAVECRLLRCRQVPAHVGSACEPAQLALGGLDALLDGDRQAHEASGHAAAAVLLRARLHGGAAWAPRPAPLSAAGGCSPWGPPRLLFLASRQPSECAQGGGAGEGAGNEAGCACESLLGAGALTSNADAQLAWRGVDLYALG